MIPNSVPNSVMIPLRRQPIRDLLGFIFRSRSRPSRWKRATLTHYVDPRIARDWRAADLLPEPVINPAPMPQHVGSVTHHAPPDTVRRDAHRGPTQTSTEARGTQQRGKDGTGYVGGVDRSGENDDSDGVKSQLADLRPRVDRTKGASPWLRGWMLDGRGLLFHVPFQFRERFDYMTSEELARQNELADNLLKKLERIKELWAECPSTADLEKLAERLNLINEHLVSVEETWKEGDFPTAEDLAHFVKMTDEIANNARIVLDAGKEVRHG